MSEENQVEESIEEAQPEPIIENNVEEPVNPHLLDPVERDAYFREQAAKQGYGNPKDLIEQGRLDPKDAVSAEVFADRGQWYKIIKQQNEDLKKLTDLVTKVDQRINQAEIQGYQQALQEMQSRRKEAIELGETDIADQLTDQMVQYKQQVELAKNQNNNQGIPLNDYAKAFLHKNHQFMLPMPENKEIRDYVINRESQLMQQGVPQHQLYAQLEQDLHRYFPQTAGMPKRGHVPVASPRNTGSKKAGNMNVADLPNEAQKLFSIIERQKSAVGEKYTVEQFAKTYSLLRGNK